MIYYPDSMIVIEETEFSEEDLEYETFRVSEGVLWEMVSASRLISEAHPGEYRTHAVDPRYSCLFLEQTDPLRNPLEDSILFNRELSKEHRGLCQGKMVRFLWNHSFMSSARGPDAVKPIPLLESQNWGWDPRSDGLLPPDYKESTNG